MLDALNFDEKGLIPTIICDVETRQPLVLNYMNKEAVEKTLETGKIHVFRRSKGRLMIKGETSGHIQELQEVYVDCSNNSLLFFVKQHRACCHKGYFSCFFRKYNMETGDLSVVEERIFDPNEVYLRK